jgi:hypothetical protein
VRGALDIDRGLRFLLSESRPTHRDGGPIAPASRGESAPATSPTPFVIIGADGYLAARPATPVQVAHACRAAGYAAAIPATWGDELIAEGCARRLATRTLPSAIFCSCRRVRDRLLGPGADLLPFLVSFVAPPVATARYLRELYGDTPIDITYVGTCPSASHEPSIDRQVRPEEFYASLTDRGIAVAEEPLVFNSFFAPDRRRCHSLPGGLPIDSLLEAQDGTARAADNAGGDDTGDGAGDEDDDALPFIPRSVVEIREVEYAAELAQYLITGAPVLIDLGPRLGCACSGAVSGVTAAQARDAVIALEPPRSPTPVVEPDVSADVDLDPAADDSLGVLVADRAARGDTARGNDPRAANATAAGRDAAASFAAAGWPHRDSGIAQRG